MKTNQRRNYILFILSLFFCGIITATTTSPQSDKKALVIQEMTLGSTLQKEEDYTKSIDHFLKSIQLAKEIKNDSLLFRVYMKLGKSYLYSWQNKKAIEAYYNALTITKKNKDIDQELIAYSGLIVFLSNINKDDKAIEYSEYALRLIDKSSFKNKKNHVKVLTTICDAYMEKGDFDAMLPNLETGIEIAKNINYDAGLLDLYIKKGRYHHYKKELTAAFEVLHKAEQIIASSPGMNTFYPNVNTNYAIALCYFDQQKYDEAISYIEKSKKIITEEDLEQDNVILTYKLLAQCYAKKEDFKTSSEILNTIIEMEGVSRKGKDDAINTLHEKDSENFLLQIEALQHQDKENQQTINQMFIGIVFIMLLLVLVTFLYIKKQKANQATFTSLIKKISALEENEKIAASKKVKNTVKNITIDDNTVNEILERLHKLETQEFFLSENCNLRTVAKKVKSNTTYLSQIINKYKEKNFNEYINDLRIEYVLKRLKNDKKFRSFSVKGIASELGYKSDDSFVKHFKKKTELNPSYYIKELNKLENSQA